VERNAGRELGRKEMELLPGPDGKKACQMLSQPRPMTAAVLDPFQRQVWEQEQPLQAAELGMGEGIPLHSRVSI